MAKNGQTDTKTTEIAKITTSALVPSFMEEFTGQAGTEHLTKDDIQLPRLLLAQQMSPQLNPINPEYIDGLKSGQFFNAMTGEIYGSEIKFMVIRGDKPRGIEFADLADGGGILDANVPLDDPRMQFHGKEKPVATKFYDFIIKIYPFEPSNVMSNVLTWSFKGTSLKSATKLNFLIADRKKPIFTGVYQLKSGAKQKDKQSWFVALVDNAGWPESIDHVRAVQALFDQLKDKTVAFDRDVEDPDGVDAEKEM